MLQEKLIKKLKTMINFKKCLIAILFLASSGIYAQIVVSDGLVGYWTFDDIANAVDSGPNGYASTITGGVTATPDRFGNVGKAYLFNGSTGVVTIPSTASALNLDDNFSISAWVKINSGATSHGMGVVKWGQLAPGERRSILIWSGNGSSTSNDPNKAYFSGAWAAANVAGSSDLTADSNTWYHLAVTVDGSDNVKVYVNGQENGSGTPTLNNFTFDGVTIGASLATGTNEYFDGALDDIGIYNRVLTPAEVLEIYEYDPSNSGGGGVDCPNIYCVGDNVGIGTPDTFGYRLAVNGTIGAKEVKVETTSAWPDYVFEKEYKLPTLLEVEKYIKNKGHLHNIPSAKEVAENGILLGDMNSKLLRKIEELTLYTIQQEKEIQKLKEQNKRIEQLEEQMKKLLKNKK